MDTTKEFTAIEWCAGYGGIHLGLKRAIPNLRVIAYGEIEGFACANLVAKMEIVLPGSGRKAFKRPILLTEEQDTMLPTTVIGPMFLQNGWKV